MIRSERIRQGGEIQFNSARFIAPSEGMRLAQIEFNERTYVELYSLFFGAALAEKRLSLRACHLRKNGNDIPGFPEKDSAREPKSTNLI